MFKLTLTCVLIVLTDSASAQQIDYALRSTAAFEMDGRRDLGLAGGGTDNNAFLNLAPRLLIELSPRWTGYVRARVFLPTGRVAPFDSDEPDNPNPAKSFAGLNEFWIQYNGFTSYPGEALRIGRQHIRQNGSEWWDQDADAVRWIFDTTRLSAESGVARQFSTYRTDSADVPIAQRDRAYLFANVSADWRPENRVGLRITHAVDDVDLPQPGAPVAPDEKLRDAQLTWLGVYADNGFYNIRGAEKRFAYGSEINYLTGSQDIAQRGSGGTVATLSSQDVSAWHASAGARWHPFSKAPVLFGAAYTYSEGGGSSSRSQQYQQTGMQSNSSYFAGTQTLTGRYNETLKAELGNLLVTTAFVSLNLPRNDASLIFSTFRRDSGASPIVTDNVTVAPVNSSRDIGAGLDLVLTHYLQRDHRQQRLLDRGDAFTARPRLSLISLRGSMFRPGDAYGSAARTDYRILLELTLWRD